MPFTRFGALALLLLSATGFAEETAALPPCETELFHQGWILSGRESESESSATARSPRQRFEIRLSQNHETGVMTESFRYLTPMTDILNCDAQQADMAVIIDGADYRRATQTDICDGAQIRSEIEEGGAFLRNELLQQETLVLTYRERHPGAANGQTDLGGWDITLPARHVRLVLDATTQVIGQLRRGKSAGECAAL